MIAGAGFDSIQVLPSLKDDGNDDDDDDGKDEEIINIFTFIFRVAAFQAQAEGWILMSSGI